MSGLVPKGADLLADVRRQGFRPSDPVTVFLDLDRPRPKIYCDLPISFDVCIRANDDIASLDLWPLADLSVIVHGGDALNDRLRALLKAVRRAGPKFIAGGVPSENLLFAWHPSRGWEFEHVE